MNAAAVQQRIYNTLTSPATKQYISPARDKLGTLGEVKGKIILLRRFDLDLLETSYESTVPSIHFSPERWQDNGASITIIYNEDRINSSGDGTAHIKDYYGPETFPSSSLQENIDIKLGTIQLHLNQAANSKQSDTLYWNENLYVAGLYYFLIKSHVTFYKGFSVARIEPSVYDLFL